MLWIVFTEDGIQALRLCRLRRLRLPSRLRSLQTAMRTLGQRRCQLEKTDHDAHRLCRPPHNPLRLPVLVWGSTSARFGGRRASTV